MPMPITADADAAIAADVNAATTTAVAGTVSRESPLALIGQQPVIGVEEETAPVLQVAIVVSLCCCHWGRLPTAVKSHLHAGRSERLFIFAALYYNAVHPGSSL